MLKESNLTDKNLKSLTNKKMDGQLLKESKLQIKIPRAWETIKWMVHIQRLNSLSNNFKKARKVDKPVQHSPRTMALHMF